MYKFCKRIFGLLLFMLMIAGVNVFAASANDFNKINAQTLDSKYQVISQSVIAPNSNIVRTSTAGNFHTLTDDISSGTARHQGIGFSGSYTYRKSKDHSYDTKTNLSYTFNNNSSNQLYVIYKNVAKDNNNTYDCIMYINKININGVTTDKNDYERWIWNRGSETVNYSNNIVFYGTNGNNGTPGIFAHLNNADSLNCDIVFKFYKHRDDNNYGSSDMATVSGVLALRDIDNSQGVTMYGFSANRQNTFIHPDGTHIEYSVGSGNSTFSNVNDENGHLGDIYLLFDNISTISTNFSFGDGHNAGTWIGFENSYSDSNIITYSSVTTSVTNGTITATSNTIQSGTNYTVNYSPKDSSYEVKKITVDGTNLSASDVQSHQTSYTFNNINGIHTISVEYGLKTYTVTYDTDGGSSIANETVTHGQKVSNPTVQPVKDGYVFKGWQVNGVDVDLSTYTITGATTLKAKWELDTPKENANYTVIYKKEKLDGSYEETPETKIGVVGDTAQAVVTDYTGFSVNNSQSTLQDIVKADGSTILTVVYNRNSYTVSFDTNGGTEIAPKTVKYEGNVTNIETPTKDGFTFKGWQVNGVDVVPGTMEIKENTVLTAKWEETLPEEAGYKVIYKKEKLDGTYEETTENKTGVVGDTAQAVVTDYTGFSVNNSQSTLQDIIQADGSTVLTVVYNRNSYTVSFDTNGGTEINPKTVKYEDNVTNVPTPEKEGFNFIGWQANGVDVIPEMMEIKENTVLTAKWEAKKANYTVITKEEKLDETFEETSKTETGNVGETATVVPEERTGFSIDNILSKLEDIINEDGSTLLEIIYKRNNYTVSFDTNGGTSIPDKQIKYEGTIGNIPTPEKEGYAFTGWQVDGVDIDINTYPVKENTVLTAKWEKTNAQYTVIYKEEKLDGTYSETSETKNGIIGNTVTLEPENHQGFKVDETQSDLEEVVLEDGSTVLTVVYKRNNYNLQIDTNGGTEIPDQQIKYDDTPKNITEPTKEGYEFIGWEVDGQIIDIDNYPIQEDTVIIAKWKKVIADYTIIYKSENIDGTYEEINIKETGTIGEVVKIIATEIEGYDLDTTNSNLEEEILEDGSTVLTVVYKRDSHTVQFDTDGGSKIPDQEIKYDGTTNKIEEPTKEGYKFIGWEVDGEEIDINTYPIKEDTVLKAKWEKIVRNPRTGDSIITYLIILLISAAINLIIIKKIKNK